VGVILSKPFLLRLLIWGDNSFVALNLLVRSSLLLNFLQHNFYFAKAVSA